MKRMMFIVLAPVVLGFSGCSMIQEKLGIPDPRLLKAQVDSLEKDMTTSKQILQQMALLLQQQSVAIKNLEARVGAPAAPKAKPVAAARPAPVAKKQNKKR